jgi:hypothetical protein
LNFIYFSAYFAQKERIVVVMINLLHMVERSAQASKLSFMSLPDREKRRKRHEVAEAEKTNLETLKLN